MNDAIYLSIAAEVAKLSRCTRLQVGAVVVAGCGVVLAAHANQPEGECTGVVGACGCTHAESSALDWSFRQLAVESVYVTHQPCARCAEKIIRAGGVRRVRWIHPYRLTDGAELLASAGIDARRVEL